SPPTYCSLAHAFGNSSHFPHLWMLVMVLFGQGKQRVSWSGRIFLFVSCLLALVGAWAVVQRARRAQISKSENERPQVASNPSRPAPLALKYVGDEACARCHSQIAKTYHQHPMARSCAP